MQMVRKGSKFAIPSLKMAKQQWGMSEFNLILVNKLDFLVVHVLELVSFLKHSLPWKQECWWFTIAFNIHYVSTDYVEEIFQSYMTASKSDLTEAAAELCDKTPAPMNTMVEKQPREEALQKKIKRRSMEIKDVPPTTPGR